MSTIAETPCDRGEDLRFLAYCAISGDFSMLLDGRVKPEQMSEDGAVVAQWVLNYRQAATGSWPPDYDSLKEQFEYLEWPQQKSRSVDPEIAAVDVWMSYRLFQCHEIMTEVQTLSQVLWNDPEYTETIQGSIERLQDLSYIGKPGGRVEKFGTNPDEIIEIVTGVRPTSSSRLTTPFGFMNDLLVPLDPGIHATFARPKNGKSFYLQLLAVHNCMGEGARARGLLVDPENSRATIITRLAAAFAGVSMHVLRDLHKALLFDEEITHEMRVAKAIIEEAAFEIQQRSELYIIGKEDVDPDYGFISIDRIEDVYEESGASVLFIDQGHLIVDPRRHRASDDLTRRIYKAMERLDQKDDRPIFLTTQDRRPPTAKGELRFPSPSKDTVFGGDAVAQKCQSLMHLQSFEIDKKSIVSVFTPLVSRNTMSGTSSAPHAFVRASFFNDIEEMDPYQGHALVESLIQEEKNRAEAAKREGRRMARDGDDGAPKADLKDRFLRSKLKGRAPRKASAAAEEDE